MKTFKAICAATVMALALSTATLADPPPPGDGHSPGRTAPTSGGIVSSIPEGPELIGETPGNDFGFLTVADVLWALASIY
jgi:hypothetical protein